MTSINPVAGGRREFCEPKTEIQPLTKTARKYLTEKRGLKVETLEAFGVGCTSGGNIAVPFFDENNQRRLVKMRHPEGGLLNLTQANGTTNQVKTYAEKGGKPVLLGSHLCTPQEGPLVMCFGDYDAMSVYQSGIPNTVSLPFGDKGLDFIKEQWDFLESFSKVILFPDLDNFPNKEAAARSAEKLDQLATRLGKHRTFIVQDLNRAGTKDANELLTACGEEVVRRVVEEAKFYPEPHLIKVADFEDEEFKVGRPTGYEFIDKNTGGFGDSDLVLIAGDNGAGKTTLALNLIAQSVDLRVPALFWSGEQKVGRIRYWFHRIVAGPAYLKHVTQQSTGFSLYFPLEEYLSSIKDWYRDYFYQVTDFFIDAPKFFEIAELGIRRYGIKLIVIDNLMAFTGGEGEGYYQAQGDFVQSCKMFAAKWNVTVILIVHNRKWKSDSEEFKLPTKDDIEGAKKISNWADTILQLARIPDEHRKGAYEGLQGAIGLCKSRESGVLCLAGTTVDAQSNRITSMPEAIGAPRIYGWEKIYQNGNI